MHSEFSLSDDIVCKNVIIIGVDKSLSVHIDNKKKYILFLGKSPTHRLDDTTLKAQYLINFFKIKQKFCLSLHHNRSSKLLFLNATKIYKFKAKDFEIKKHLLFL